MSPRLERTDVAQQEFDGVIEVIDWEELELPFDDDEPLECGIENPEGCEACS